MASLADELDLCAAEQAAAIHTCSAYSRTTPRRSDVPPDAPDQVQSARQSILESATKMQRLLDTPVTFLQRLARQNQLLADLQWLCEFQILACIPLDEAVPISDVAFLANVPESQLQRVVRMVATAGFLRESDDNCLAHTELSKPFVTNPHLLDTATFLSSTAAPAALKMSAATRLYPGSQRPDESAYSLAFNTPSTFAELCELEPRLLEQCPAYFSHGIDDEDKSIQDVLMQVDWANLHDVTVVDVGARSTNVAASLAGMFPSLRFSVQPDDLSALFNNGITSPTMNGAGMASIPNHIPDLSSRISVLHRPRGSYQFVRDAAVYIIRIRTPFPATPVESLTSQVAAELSAHMDVLSANPASRLLLTARVSPAPGTVDPDIEASARLRDLALLQLMNGREAEAGEIHDVLNAVRDGEGGLVLTNELRSQTSAVVAFEIQYRTYADNLTCRPFVQA